ncbi:MAG TPA: MFS transporter [Terracidiphilus sp.]|jgi:MFS family permease
MEEQDREPLTIQETHAGTAIPRRRWRIAWLLGLGVLVNYFDRVNLSASHAALIATFGISNVAFGYLSGAYNLTYCCCQLPIGVILDKFGVRRVGRIGTFLWSVATFGAAVTPTLGGLFAARFLLGIGEAPTFPANAKAIGYWFPPRERSFATALFDSAAKFASVIGIPLVGLVLLKAGWRWSFALTGFISLAYFLFFWRVYKDPADDPALSEAERRHIDADEEAFKAEILEPAQIQQQARQPQAQLRVEQPQSSLRDLLTERKVLGLALGFGSYNYVFYLLLTWLPSYLAFALHIDLLHSFLYTSVPWIFATFTDLVIGGWLVDFLVQRGRRASLVRRTVLIGGTACGLGILGAVHAHSAPQALLWISISIGGLSAASPVGWSLPSLIASRQDAGKVGGIINFSNQISGIFAPIITGYLVEARHSYAWAFRVSAIYLVIGIAGYVFLLGAIEPPPKRNGPLREASS